MADGYGVAAVRLALERFLGGPRDDLSPADDALTDASSTHLGTRARGERG